MGKIQWNTKQSLKNHVVGQCHDNKTHSQYIVKRKKAMEILT